MSMSNNFIRFPIDLERRHDFRLLLQEMDGNEALTLAIFFRLFRELQYLAQEGNEPGLITAAAWPMVVEELDKLDDEPPDWDRVLVGTSPRLLRRQDEGGGHVCPAFVVIAAAEPAARATASIPALGTAVSKVSRASRRLAEDPGLHLFLDEALFAGATGQPAWTSEERQSAAWLVHSIDSLLDRPRRQPHEFTVGLVTDAREALGFLGSRDATHKVLVGLAKLRVQTPAHFTGLRAEAMLRDWKQWAAKVPLV